MQQHSWKRRIAVRSDGDAGTYCSWWKATKGKVHVINRKVGLKSTKYKYHELHLHYSTTLWFLVKSLEVGSFENTVSLLATKNKLELLVSTILGSNK